VQQEKQKLNKDCDNQMQKYDDLTETFNGLKKKFTLAVNEKMLMTLEKNRLIAKVESLELSMN